MAFETASLDQIAAAVQVATTRPLRWPLKRRRTNEKMPAKFPSPASRFLEQSSILDHSMTRCVVGVSPLHPSRRSIPALSSGARLGRAIGRFAVQRHCIELRAIGAPRFILAPKRPVLHEAPRAEQAQKLALLRRLQAQPHPVRALEGGRGFGHGEIRTPACRTG